MGRPLIRNYDSTVHDQHIWLSRSEEMNERKLGGICSKSLCLLLAVAMATGPAAQVVAEQAERSAVDGNRLPAQVFPRGLGDTTLLAAAVGRQDRRDVRHAAGGGTRGASAASIDDFTVDVDATGRSCDRRRLAAFGHRSGRRRRRGGVCRTAAGCDVAVWLGRQVLEVVRNQPVAGEVACPRPAGRNRRQELPARAAIRSCRASTCRTTARCW